MKRFVAMILTAGLVLGGMMGNPEAVQAETLLNAAAQGEMPSSGKWSNTITWNYNKENRTLTVSGTGKIPDNINHSGDPSRLAKSLVVEEGITGIGKDAFSRHNCLESIQLPETLVTIGDYSFLDCRKLQNVTIPKNVKTIGEQAFMRCGTKSIVIPDNVSVIGDRAFYESPFLEEAEIGNGIITQGKYVFGECPRLKKATVNCQAVGTRSFEGCRLLETVTLGTGVTAIGEGAFSDCTSLKSISLPDSVITIGTSAFDGCCNLDTVSFGNGVTNIGEMAFSECHSLTSVTLPKTLLRLGDCAFSDCSHLQSVAVPDELGSFFADNKTTPFLSCGGIRSVTLGYSAVGSGSNPFSHSGNIKEITFHGTKAEWKDVTAKYAGSGDNLLRATVNCNDGVINFTPDVSLNSLSGNCGANATWSYSDADGMLTVTGSGIVAFGEDAKLSIIKSRILTVNIDKGITEIGDLAFSELSDNIQEVSLPEDLERIGSKAFSGCYLLQKIEIPDSVGEIGESAFSGCGQLASVKLPGYLSEIKANTFDGCSSLGTVSIPASVTKIGSLAFRECGGLMSADLGSGLIEIGKGAFMGCSSLPALTLPETLKTIGEEAFTGCSALSGITFPNALTGLGDNSFCDTGLSNIQFGNGLTMVPNGAFMRCYRLEEIALPENIQMIGTNAFYRDYSLSGITGADSVESVGGSAFLECVSLKSFPAGSKLKTIGNASFRECVCLTGIPVGANTTTIGTEAFFDCSGITEALLDGVEKIGDLAFVSCVALEKLQFGNNLKSIGKAAFSNCISFSGVKIPDQAESIGDRTFEFCGSLTDVTLGTGLKSIGEDAFFWTALESIFVPKSVTSIGPAAFSSCFDNELLIKDIYYEGSEENWQKICADWRAYVESGVTMHYNCSEAGEPGNPGEGGDSDPTDPVPGTGTTPDLDNSPVPPDEVKVITEELKKDPDHQLWIYGLKESYDYTGEAIEPAVLVYYGTTRLVLGKDYTIKYKNNKAPSTDSTPEEKKPSLTVTGKGNFTGSKTVTFNIKEYTFTGTKDLKKAKITGIQNMSYTGSPVTQDTIAVTYGGETLKPVGADGKGDFVLSYSRNIDAGTAYVFVTGRGDYFGTVKKSFKITPVDLSKAGEALSVTVPQEVLYTAGGAMPVPSVTWKSPDGHVWTLHKGTDYKVTYKDNKKLSGNGKKAYLTLTGSGNYTKKSPEVYFTVKEGDLSRLTMSAPDIKYDAKKKGTYYQSKIKIYDKDGKILKSKDYTLSYYNASRGMAVIDKNTTADAVNENDVIEVKAEGKGNYAGSTLTGQYRILAAAKDLGKAKAAKIADIPYDGKAKVPGSLTITFGTKPAETLIKDQDYEIVWCINNVEKGKASMLLRGKGAFSGTKLLTYKIVAAKASDTYKGAWNGNTFR